MIRRVDLRNMPGWEVTYYEADRRANIDWGKVGGWIGAFLFGGLFWTGVISAILAVVR